MENFKVIPAIDIMDGKCVRLFQGEYGRKTMYDNDPTELAQTFMDHGLNHIHVIDLDGARAGYPVNLKVVEAIARTGIKIELGGGLRTGKDIQNALGSGAGELILGSILIDEEKQIRDLLVSFPGKLIAGIDSRQGLVAIKGWKNQTAVRDVDLAVMVEKMGFSRIIYTDIARDGAMKGPNLKRLKTLSSCVSIPVTASGGIRHLDDIRMVKTLKRSGITGVIVGRAYIEGRITVEEMGRC